MRLESWFERIACKTRLVIGATLLLAIGGAVDARADVINTFAVSGTFLDGAKLGGTIAIDVTTGIVTSAALTVSSASGVTFNHISQTGTGVFDANSYNLTVDTGGTFPYVYLEPYANGGTLVGYGGGALYSASQTGSDDGYSIYRASSSSRDNIELQSGALTLQVNTPVPEPASLAVVLAGLAGLIAARRRYAGNDQRRADDRSPAAASD